MNDELNNGIDTSGRDVRNPLLRQLSGLVVLLDDRGKIQRWNHELERVTGYAPGALAGRAFRELLVAPSTARQPPDRGLADPGVVRTGQHSGEIVLRDSSGATRTFAVSRRGVTLDGHNYVALIGADVSDRKLEEARERRRNDILTRLARGAPLDEILDRIARAVEAEEPTTICSILLYDERDRCLHHGAAPNLPAFYTDAIDGLPIGDGMGSCGTAAARGERVIVDDIAQDPLWARYQDITLKAGLRACWSRPLFASNGQLLGTFAIYHRPPRSPNTADIERIERTADLASLAIERSRLADALAYAASHDSLTGLYNRGRIDEFLAAEIARAERYGNRFSVVLLDIDHFKAINDTHGHRLGDRVLRQLGRRLAEETRESDVTGRWGGEEFLVVLPETGYDGAYEWAEAQRARFADTPFPVVERITVSLGVAEYQPGEGFDGVVNRADIALYRAKTGGRNRVASL